MAAGTEGVLTGKEYEKLVEQAPIMIWRSDTTAGCDYFNGRWLEFTGKPMERELGNGWAEGVHPDDLQRCLDTYLGAFNKREIFEMEYRLMHRDGQYRWLFDRGVPFFGAVGEFLGYIGSCTDVTERVAAQEELRKAKEKEIQTLRGLLPICSICKNIRDDEGYWTKIERYIQKHSEAQFSHGICPECAKRFYPEFAGD